jgi:hypothetical protein
MIFSEQGTIGEQSWDTILSPFSLLADLEICSFFFNLFMPYQKACLVPGPVSMANLEKCFYFLELPSSLVPDFVGSLKKSGPGTVSIYKSLSPPYCQYIVGKSGTKYVGK